MTSLGLKGSSDLGKLRIDPEEYITGVGLKMSQHSRQDLVVSLAWLL